MSRARRPAVRFAANLSTLWPKVPFAERAALAQKAGFSRVEAQFPQRDMSASVLRSELQRCGLSMVLMNIDRGPREGDLGLAVDPQRGAEFQASLNEAREYANEVDAPKLHCMAGRAPAGVKEAEAQDCFLERLALAADALAEDGREVLIEPLAVRGYHLRSVHHAMSTIDSLNRPNVKLQFDFYHVQSLHGDVTQLLRRCFPYVGHVQLSGVPGRHEPDGQQELNYPFLLAELQRLSYDGAVGCEYWPREGGQGFEWMSAYELL